MSVWYDARETSNRCSPNKAREYGMSFFADFILASKKDAKKVANTDNPAQTWPGVSLKNLTCLDIAALYGVFLGKTGDQDVVDLIDEFEDLPCANESVELHMVPVQFVDCLAAVEQKKMRAIAKAWQASEVEVSNWPLDEVRDVLGELTGLARKAKDAKSPIMVCISGF